MFCTNCGANVPEGHAFCTVCGNPMNGEAQAKAQPAAVPTTPAFDAQSAAPAAVKAPTKLDLMNGRDKGMLFCGAALLLLGLILSFTSFWVISVVNIGIGLFGANALLAVCDVGALVFLLLPLSKRVEHKQAYDVVAFALACAAAVSLLCLVIGYKIGLGSLSSALGSMVSDIMGQSGLGDYGNYGNYGSYGGLGGAQNVGAMVGQMIKLSATAWICILSQIAAAVVLLFKLRSTKE